MRGFTEEVQKKLGHYVYLYIDPGTGRVFYVGKGAGNRAFSHLLDRSESAKQKRIREIRKLGGEPRIELLAHGLDEPTALRVEAAAIDLLGKENLANRIQGWHSGVQGRMTVEQLEAHYAAAEARILHPSILIRINDLFRYGMSDIELYDATRCAWKVGPQRKKAKLALAVFDGIVQEVYEIEGWYPAGSTLLTREARPRPDRWEFVGRIAAESIRKRYRLKSVRSHFSRGAQNPIRYVRL